MIRAGVDREAMTVAMALVPGMYSRNRFFSMFREPEVKRARARAAMIRGVVRQLAGAHGAVESLSFARTGDVVALRYRLPRMRLERRVDLSETERACLVFLASKSGVEALPASAEDRALVDGVLRRLGGELSPNGEARVRPSEFPR